ncbi:MAG: hypothetical protein E7663_01780 [Ruminococcaceae bacterium]|nr:hypothetical protein [Oscillospiraceae bacterium]
MSKLLMELTGHRCSIQNDRAEYLGGNADAVCDVLDVDAEWIKYAYTDQYGRQVTRLDRLDIIDSVEILS